MPRAVPASASHTLIERASRILATPPAADPRTALSDATVVINAHRPAFLMTHCRACGMSWQCPGRIEGDRRAALALQRIKTANVARLRE